MIETSRPAPSGAPSEESTQQPRSRALAPYPASYQIRDVRVEPPIALAPMEGVTDLTFRRLIRGVGGTGITCTEFIASRGLKHGGGRMWRNAQFDADERPVSIQIYGRDPEAMARAAGIVEEMGATVCDINMGCPSKKVCRNSGGSGLMKEPELAAAIVRAVRARIQIPLTVKMRSGFDADRRNAPELAWICQEEGAEALAIHWRTREDRYGGERAVDKIAEAKARVSIPVVANGDIVDIESARAMFDETGCDGVMIGRGAIQNPWLPLQISQWLRGAAPIQPDAAEKRRVLMMYYDGITEAFETERGALGRMKMVTGHFTRGLPLGDALRVKVQRSQRRVEAVAFVEDYFERLIRFESGDDGAFSDSAFSDAAA